MHWAVGQEEGELYHHLEFRNAWYRSAQERGNRNSNSEPIKKGEDKFRTVSTLRVLGGGGGGGGGPGGWGGGGGRGGWGGGGEKGREGCTWLRGTWQG